MAFASFDISQREAKLRLWNSLIKNFLQRFINPKLNILEIGSGWGEFINQVSAKEKHAVDIDESFKQYADNNVIFSVQDVRDLGFRSGSFDQIFASNVFEHLEKKTDVKKAVRELRRILHLGGTLIILQPNYKFCSKIYFDFSDHYTVWTDRSMRELLIQEGFEIKYLIERFIPFSISQRYPTHTIFMYLYLKMPFLWKIFGQQFLIVAKNIQ